MNYQEMAAKANPFEGLDDEQSQRMVVYLHILAPVRMNDTQIFRKYGFVLPMEKRLTAPQELRMAAQILQEIG